MEDAHAVKPKPKQSAIHVAMKGRLVISPFLLILRAAVTRT
jgi:hypothetical protein